LPRFDTAGNRRHWKRALQALSQSSLTARTEADAARKKADEQSNLLERVFQYSHDCLVLLDRDFNFIRVNQAYADVCKRNIEDFVGHNHFEFYPSPFINDCKRVVETGVPFRAYARPFVFPDHPEWGETYWDLSVVPLSDQGGDAELLLLTLKDVSDRVRSERAHKRIEQALKTLIASNILMVHAKDELELMRGKCRLLVEVGGYCMAWIGYVLQDAQKTIQPFAYTGAGAEGLENIKLSWEDNEYGKGASGEAIREEKTIVRRELVNSDCLKWCPLATQCAHSSCIALPLRDRDGIYGVLSIYADKSDAFQAEEVVLLESFVQDLTYAVNNLRTKSARESAERKLGESEQRYRLILDNAADAVYIVNAEGQFTYANNQAQKMLGYTVQKLLTMGIADITPADQVGEELEDFSEFKVNGTLRKEINQKHRDGRIIPVELSAVRLPDGSFFGSCRDITERKHAEQQAARYVEQLDDYLHQLEESMQGTLLAISNMVEQRDPYTAGHESRVGTIASAIACELGWDEKRCRELEMVGLVHDIGKIGIPTEILVKPTRLTAIEYEMVKGHAEKGYEILKDVKFPLPIAEIIRQHHERIDGSGYPRGLKGGQILPEACVLAVADVIESMASHRPYRPALGIQNAIKEITQYRGILYDANVVDAMLALINEKGYQLPS
jgi:PAS domain S-box-containing protein/putative nucleotidyltransferase with HDIG domain